MARKPGPLRELAIDLCRIPTTRAERDWMEATARPNQETAGWGSNHGTNMRAPAGFKAPEGGRWPANIILTDPIFDGGIEGVVGGGDSGPAGVAVRRNVGHSPGRFGFASGSEDAAMTEDVTYGDSGTYSRFFLIPKSSRSDREPIIGRDGSTRFNTHPTVKSTDLMRHLVRLVTPSGGVVLDPFLGSGSTGLACELEGFKWIGIEREAEYVAISEARLNGTQKGLGLAG
jgi:site-specific DNA-methyltransferase (adenine-specific)